jgi:hypothetical protein
MGFLVTGTDRIGRLVLRRETAAAARKKGEAANGNREFFLNKPHGGTRRGDVP